VSACISIQRYLISAIANVVTRFPLTWRIVEGQGEVRDFIDGQGKCKACGVDLYIVARSLKLRHVDLG